MRRANFIIENRSILIGNYGSASGRRYEAEEEKPKIASSLPRRTWKINPLTKVKPSDKIYSRKKAKPITGEEF